MSPAARNLPQARALLIARGPPADFVADVDGSLTVKLHSGGVTEGTRRLPKLKRKFFTFTGRMRRRSFVRASLGFCCLMLLAAWLGVALLAWTARANGLEPGDPAFRLMLVVGGGALVALAGVSLSAMIIKRSRDAGLPPAPFMVAILLTPLADPLLLAPLLDHRLPWPLEGATPAMPLVVLTAYAILAFKPSLAIAPLHAVEERDVAGAARG